MPAQICNARWDERHKKGRRECNNVNDVFRHVEGMEGRREGKGREGKRLVVFLENKTKKFRIYKDIARLKEHPDDCTRRDAE